MPGPIGMEVADVSVAHEQLISSMVTFVEDAEPDTVENFPGHMINRQVFDRHLCQLAEDDGATCIFGSAIKTVKSDGIVVLSDGTRIVPKVIIGADGHKSVTLRLRLGADEGTLVREQIDDAAGRVMAALQDQLGGVIRN